MIAIGVHGKETGTAAVETVVSAVEIVGVVVSAVPMVEVTAAEDSQLKVFLNQAGEAPVVPISRKMEDDKNDRLEDKAAKCQIAA